MPPVPLREVRASQKTLRESLQAPNVPREDLYTDPPGHLRGRKPTACSKLLIETLSHLGGLTKTSVYISPGAPRNPEKNICGYVGLVYGSQDGDGLRASPARLLKSPVYRER